LIQDDEVTLVLPSGFGVEELPTKTVLHAAYGSYENDYGVKDGTIVFHRILKLNPLVVPVADYPKFRQFLASASKADREAIVLRIAQ
jgi:ABC-type transport system substrate-binding protein